MLKNKNVKTCNKNETQHKIVADLNFFKYKAHKNNYYNKEQR